MKELTPFFSLFRKHSLQLSAGVILSFLAFVASICLLAVSGWFLSATALAGLTLMTSQTFNFFTPGAAVRGFAIMRTATRYFERVINHDATFRLLARLRTNCFEKLQPLAADLQVRYQQGDILNRLTSDIDTLDQLYLSIFSPFICATLTCCFVVILTLFFSGTVALVLGIAFLVCLTVLPPVFYALGNASGQTLIDKTSQLRIAIVDYINAYTEIIVNNAGGDYRSAIIEKQKMMHQMQEKMAYLTGLASALSTVASGLTLIIILYFIIGAVSHRLFNGPIAAMLTLATIASFEAIAPLPSAMQILGKVKRSATRINELTQQKPAVVFPSQSSENFNPASEVDIEFNDLCYQYSNSPYPVLDHFSFKVRPREKIAITGHTGCGKSTLVNLLTRSDKLQHGSIQINGINIDTLTEPHIRKLMSVMPQRIHIFSGTLRDNLRIACHNASDQYLESILSQLDLTEKNTGLTLNSWIGEGGRTLSGGEARRVGVARVLLQNAPIVLLDEPSEGLDIVTEQKVLSTLVNYCQNRTVIAVTHKPAILAYMDKIIRWNQLAG